MTASPHLTHSRSSAHPCPAIQSRRRIASGMSRRPSRSTCFIVPLSIRLRDWIAGQGWALDLEWVKWGLAVITLPVVAWSGQQFYRGTWSGLRHRTADMNTLIGVGTGAAYLYSLVATAAPTLFLRAGL